MRKILVLALVITVVLIPLSASAAPEISFSKWSSTTDTPVKINFSGTGQPPTKKSSEVTISPNETDQSYMVSGWTYDGSWSRTYPAQGDTVVTVPAGKTLRDRIRAHVLVVSPGVPTATPSGTLNFLTAAK